MTGTVAPSGFGTLDGKQDCKLDHPGVAHSCKFKTMYLHDIICIRRI